MQNLFGKQEGAKNIGNHLSIIIYHHNAPMNIDNFGLSLYDDNYTIMSSTILLRNI